MIASDVGVALIGGIFGLLGVTITAVLAFQTNRQVHTRNGKSLGRTVYETHKMARATHRLLRRYIHTGLLLTHGQEQDPRKSEEEKHRYQIFNTSVNKLLGEDSLAEDEG